MMGRLLSVGVAALLVWAAAARGQEDQEATESTYESTTITTTESERYLKAPVLFDDAVPQPTHTMEFALRWEYETASQHDDDTGIGVHWIWGPCKNVETTLRLPINLGDGGKLGDSLDGNADLTWGLKYRFWDEGQMADWVPSFAFRTELRMPTGDRSSGVDAEFRAILTKTLGGACRGHINAFATTVNGNNDPDARHFQWGFVFGVDAPLTPARDLWVIVDYIHRSSETEGSANMNVFEAGLEWEFAQAQSIQFTTDVGLDDNADTPNWGAKIQYTYALAY